MKKIYILVLLMVAGLSNKAFAQAATVTTEPQKFTALDEVSFLIDVTGTSLANSTEPLYLWAWSGSTNFATNGQWDNSSEAAKLTPVADKPNVYTFTLPVEIEGTTYNNVAEILGATPGEVKSIGMLIKTKVGNDAKKTPDIAIELDPLVFVESFSRIFPSVVTQHDLVTIYMNQRLSTNAEVRYAVGNFTIVMHAFNEAGEAVGEEKTFEMKAEGNNRFSFTFFPIATAFPDLTEIATLRYHFVAVENQDVQSEVSTISFVR